jgi:hypothetical protein
VKTEIISEMDSWNAIGKHWLQKYDNKFGVDFFLCKCYDIKGLDIASIPRYYQDAITNIYLPAINSTGPNLKTTLMNINSKLKT